MNIKRNPRKVKNYGFTMAEMMIAMAIAAILAAIAMPSFRTISQNNAITSQANALVTAMNFARSEASKRGSRVVMCRTLNPDASNPTCGGNTQDWTTGWLIYSVSDNRTTPLYDTTKGDVLVGTGKPTPNVTIKTNSYANKNFEYNADGSTNEGGTTIFSVCDNRGYSHGKHVSILPVGRPKVIAATTCSP